MANSPASEFVSWPFHDSGKRGWHNANMANKAKTRWFLKEWRKHRGYTQERLADMTSLSKPYISRQLEALARILRPDLFRDD